MSVDPQVIHAEVHVEIGGILQRHVNVILERWSKRAAQEQPHAQRVHHDVLLNRLVDLLVTLGQSLAESQAPHNGRHRKIASIHGEQRWENGWSLSELIRDFQILRLVVLEYLEESLNRSLTHREAMAVGLVLDEAIAASAVMYMKGRDDHIRELEEKRAEEDRQMHQRLREQAEALRDADRRKNEYLAMLAHELRNPLAPVRNAIQVLKLKAPADPELQWPREVIERQVQQMSSMIDDLFDVSRISLGKVKLTKQPTDLTAIVSRAVEIARPFIDAKKHQLTVTLPPGNVRLDADVSRMTQVLVNLLTNAAKFTDEGGRIWLSAECIHDELVLKVRDSGIGISAEVLPRIFDAFTQEERSMDRAQGGLGIGLTLARTLVDLHGGRIQASSAGRGQGSEFAIYLPIANIPSNPTPKDSTDTPSNGQVSRRRVLVVDDLRDAAETLAMLLRLLGHDVRTANDGKSAIEIASVFTPQLVLLDIGLPGMDGLEVAQCMRREPGLRDIILVALTGYGDEEVRRRTQAAGFNAHLIKPVDLQELHTLLTRSDQVKTV
ncbi:MAG TPA: ATP-binding protein [Gemmataceae bacterium]|nr:ATP-binding protein [Gemmataceae bacterium]